jgi:serine/threonine protein kinase HipA of HipAB toxin-antitoxin module
MAKNTPNETDVDAADRGPDRRQSVIDRRLGIDRRALQLEQEQAEAESAAAAEEAARDASSKAVATNLERRRGPGRRRTDFMRTAEEGEMSQEQFLFLMAIDAFKRVNGKTFPTWTDVLEVIRKLGYRKTMESELELGGRAEDWTEQADAPAGVFKEERGEDEDEE